MKRPKIVQRLQIRQAQAHAERESTQYLWKPWGVTKEGLIAKYEAIAEDAGAHRQHNAAGNCALGGSHTDWLASRGKSRVDQANSHSSSAHQAIGAADQQARRQRLKEVDKKPLPLGHDRIPGASTRPSAARITQRVPRRIPSAKEFRRPGGDASVAPSTRHRSGSRGRYKAV